ncbi:formate hydrogenlyase [Saccharolobus caldissimus]|uniref:Hydrogenase n=1 Tax=Saccharolobus caldissimus TaxID=1702097 RepID=A0AAQ4CQ04_9CREN|nr:formate hydrogenlyase [Saccharolobus caldissimus]BDB97885.1 hydrogenase [Saccharolobus caldissimus]
MKHYKWSDKGEGRKIGKIGNYCLYDKVITEESCEETNLSPDAKYYGAFKFVYGPSAGGLLESIKFDITTDGERILNINSIPYKIRKIKVTGLSWEDALLKIERINAPFSASHIIAFLLAIEDAMNIEQDYQTQLKRIALLELERIRNHLFVIARLTEAASLSVPTFHLLYLIEETNRLIGKLCGHRYFFGVNYINKVNCNFEKLFKILDIVKEFRLIFEGLLESRIFIDRLQQNGILRDRDSIGPAARAAGLEYDARLELNILPYKEIGFKIVKAEDADAFGRFLVRGYEIIESSKILIELTDIIKDNTNTEEYKAINDEGEGLARVESPSGDLAYYVKIKEGRVTSAQLLSPSYVNLKSFMKSVKGTIFTDFQFNWESFGIWISEIGVNLE